MFMEKWTDESAGITLYLGNCKEILHTIKEEVDLILCDPPYGMNFKCGSATGKLASHILWRNIIGDNESFDPTFLLDSNKPTVLWGGNWFSNKLPPMSGWLVWDKKRPDTLDQATCELAWTNCVKGVRRFAHLWNGMIKESEQGESYHPAQKPVALMSWVLELRWLRDSNMILDPYMGSGSVGVACVRSRRKYIGIEIDKEYFETAKRRIQRELINRPMF
jgi:DNA modification methylase